MGALSGQVSTSRQSVSSSRLPYVQGLRAIAVLAVIAFHAGLPLPGGFVGVDVFFVISGFVITLMLMREHRDSGTIRLRTFYRRRFQRLAPALALMVLVTVLLSAVVLSPFGYQQRAAMTAAGAQLSVANFVIALTTGGYFDFVAAVNPLLHTWSLSVEEQFYLVFPGLLLLSWLVSRKLGARWVTPAVLVIGCLVTFALATFGSLGWTPKVGASLLGFYSPVTRAWEFGVGALLALAAARVHLLGRVVLGLAGWCGAALLAASFVFITESTPFPGPWTLLPVAGTLLLLMSGLSPVSRVPAVLSRRPVVTIGDWSYSLYLWHWPLIVFAVLVWPTVVWAPGAAALVAFAPAVLSFRGLEQPIRRRRAPSRRWLTGLVLITVVPPLVAAAGLYVGANRGWGIDEVVEQQARGPHDNGLPTDCMNFLTIKGLQPANLASCTFNPEGRGRPIYLLGDSNAAMYGQAFIKVAEQTDRPLVVSTAADCPFSDINRVSQWGVRADRACRDYFEDTVKWLSGQPKGTVVLASAIRYAGDPTYSIGFGSSRPESSLPARINNLEQGTLSAVRSLQDLGEAVVLVQPTYRFEAWNTPITMDRCSLLSIVSEQCPITLPVSGIADWQRRMREAVDRVAEATGATLLDLEGLQCPSQVCSDTSDGVRVYDDPGHLTIELTMRAVPEMAQAIQAADQTEASLQARPR